MTIGHLSVKTYRLSSGDRAATIRPHPIPLLSGHHQMLLKDKVALITGGAGVNGLGFATARRMAELGARVAILDLARAEPQAAAARLGEGHIGLVADVTDKATCEAAAAAVLQ